MITEADVAAGIDRLGLNGARVELHASLKSFGQVDGGGKTVVRALTSQLATILVPAFCWESMVAEPKENRLERNAYPTDDNDERPPAKVFDPELSPIQEGGAIARELAGWRGAVRSNHPLNSWVAWGDRAEYFIDGHVREDPFMPIRKLAEADGVVMLLGVTLTACTALHFAEVLAGRNAFVRWVLDGDGQAKPAGTGGCSDGFDRLMPRVESIFRETGVGSCRILAAPLKELIAKAADIIRKEPEITMCAARCGRCVAAVAGGPVQR